MKKAVKSVENGKKSFVWKIEPRKEVELVGQAFKKKPSVKAERMTVRTKYFWHINQDHDALVLGENKFKELEVEPVQENEEQNKNYAAQVE